MEENSMKRNDRVRDNKPKDVIVPPQKPETDNKTERSPKRKEERQKVFSSYKPSFVKPKDWSDEDLKYLYIARSDGIDYYLIANTLKKSIDDVKKTYRNLNWDLSPYFNQGKEKTKEQTRKYFIDDLVDSRDKKYQQNNDKTDFIIDRLIKVIRPFDKAPDIYIPNKSSKPNTPEDACLVLSDVHIGEKFTLEETGGIGEYNMKKMNQYKNNLKVNVADIIKLHSNLYEIPTLHVFCLGDLVHGMNEAGEWSSTSIEIPIYDQWSEGCNMLADMIHYWLGVVKNINFYGVVGNHGRCSEKGIEKHYVNWDLLCYKHLELLFRNNPRVKFNCPLSWYISTQIKNHRFFLIHGDELSSSGNPLQKVADCESKMVGILKQIPNYTIAGHFHNPGEMSTNNGKIIMNGSWPGGDVYSLRSLQKNQQPVQKLFGLHDNYGITWTYDMRLNANKINEDKI